MKNKRDARANIQDETVDTGNINDSNTEELSVLNSFLENRMDNDQKQRQLLSSQ